MENENRNNLPKKVTKENIYAIVLLVLFCFWTIASVLGVIAFFRPGNDDKIVASAYSVPDDDTIVKVEEGIYEIPLLGLLGDINSIGYGQLHTVNTQYITLICDNNGIKFRRYINNGTDTQLQTLYEDTAILTLSNTVSLPIKSYVVNNDSFSDFTFTCSILQTSLISNFQDFLPARVSYKFVPSVNSNSAIDIKIVWFNYKNSYQQPFDMELRLETSGAVSAVYSSYFSLNLQTSYSDYVSHRCDIISVYDFFKYKGDDYEIGVEVGKDIGYRDGLKDGYASGKIDGYDLGKADGRDLGYQEGLNDAHQFTFFNFFTAIFDVPIRALTGLFNFEFLGINLWAFLRSIITVAVIYFVIKMIF